MLINKKQITSHNDRVIMWDYLTTQRNADSDIYITSHQMYVLGIILYHGARKPINIKIISQFMNIRHSSAGRLVNSLMKKRLVETSKDGRNTNCSLTKSGKNYLDCLFSYLEQSKDFFKKYHYVDDSASKLSIVKY